VRGTRIFRGESVHKVDGKGRVSVPAEFRRVLQECDPNCVSGLNPSLVIVYGDHRRNYLECYSMQAIAKVDRQIEQLQRGSKPRRMLELMFNGQSHKTQVDETGRLVLPQKLRDKIGLGAAAHFVATGDTFQIWEPTAFAAHSREIEGWLDEYGDDFDPLTLLPPATEV